MDDQNQNPQPQQPVIPQPSDVGPQPRVSGEKVLQPTADILQEVQNQPITHVNIPVARPQNPAPAQPQGPTNTTQPPKGKDEEYNPSETRVCERATSLKLYAIVTLILTVISLLSAFSLKSSTSSSTSLVRDLTYILPIVGGAIFLLSKSVTLVKAFLIVILINYAVGFLSFLLILLTPHAGLSFTPVSLIASIIPLIFLIWTWSVFSEVELISE
jgi:hypothetical protein